MSVTLTEEFQAMLWMLLCGVLCGMAYDGICILRVLLRVSSYSSVSGRLDSLVLPGIGSVRRKETDKRSHWVSCFLIAVGDIVFAGFSACLFSIFLAHAIYGIFRWYCLLSALVGYGIYRQTIGRAVLYISDVLAGILWIIFRYFLWILLLPARGLLVGGKIAFKFTGKWLLRPAKEFFTCIFLFHYTRKTQKKIRTAICLSSERGERGAELDQ